MPKWIFTHDPEVYAYENYEKAVESMKMGISFEDDNRVPPNYPSGYKYEPWSIDQIIKDKQAGKETELGAGDWD